MHPKLAARLNQPVHHQQLQHFFPAHRFAAFRQALLPELIQSQLPPQLAPQPAVAEHTRMSQLQFPKPDLNAIDRIFGQDSVFGKQAQRRVFLPLVIEYRQTLPPRRFLLVVDLSQIQHGPLRRLACRQPPVLHDAEVAMLLAVLLSRCAAQKHLQRRMPKLIAYWKRVGLHYSLVPDSAVARIGVIAAKRPKNPKTVHELRKSG